MESFKDFVADCRKQSVTSAYIIVGKGDGILRSKVKQELQRIKIRNSEVADPPYFGNAIKVYF
jgi:DNA-nicking Smr family endonuclease